MTRINGPYGMTRSEISESLTGDLNDLAESLRREVADLGEALVRKDALIDELGRALLRWVESGNPTYNHPTERALVERAAKEVACLRKLRLP